jgi:hypothetical protein
MISEFVTTTGISFAGSVGSMEADNFKQFERSDRLETLCYVGQVK